MEGRDEQCRWFVDFVLGHWAWFREYLVSVSVMQGLGAPDSWSHACAVRHTVIAG